MTTAPDRKARLAAALRANLHRRKASVDQAVPMPGPDAPDDGPRAAPPPAAATPAEPETR